MKLTYPSDTDLREVLLQRASRFSDVTGASLSAIARCAVNDSAFFVRLAKGRNFTVGTYQRVMSWLDQRWPESDDITDSVERSTEVNRAWVVNSISMSS